MVKIFISYARADGNIIADEFADKLRALNHQVFLDIHGIPGGVKWEQTLVDKANWCDVLLVIVTPEAIESEFVYNEFREAEINKKIIVPILVDGSPPPEHLAPYNGYPFTGNNYDSILLKLENSTFPLVKEKKKQAPRRLPVLPLAIGVTIIGLVIGAGFLVWYFTRQDTVPDTFIDPDSIVAFTSNVDGNVDIWVMNGDRSNMRNITNSTDTEYDPSLSPDGQRLAFASDRDGDFEIYTISVNGTDLQQITNNDGISDGSPVWSPDGTRIAFTSWRTGNDEIFIVDLADNTVINVTNNPASDVSPAWSPDSTQLAFRSNRDGNSEIYIITLENLYVERVIDTRSQGYTVDWSPDGTQLVYDSLDGANYNVYTINIDGSNVQQLTYDPANDAEPNWSSDGQYIMFVSERVGNKELFVMGRDGSNPVNAIFNINNDANPDWQ